jgi:hypothetical protein
VAEFQNPHLRGKTLEELIEAMGTLKAGEVGSPVFEMYRAAVDLRVAELGRDAARDSLTWAKVTACSTAVATLIALIALLVAAS